MTFWPEWLLYFHLNSPSITQPFGAGCKQVIPEVCEGAIVERYGCGCTDQEQPPYGGVPGVLGMCLAPLAAVGIAGLHRVYTSVVTHCHVAESKKARTSSLQTSGGSCCCSVVWAVCTGVCSHVRCLSRAKQRHKHSLLMECIRYLSCVTFSFAPKSHTTFLLFICW